MEKSEGQKTITRSTCLTVSVLILTIMVSATTAAIIYMGVMQEPACQTDTGADDSIIKADIRVRQDGNDVIKKMTYSKKRNVAFAYNDDGTFTVNDYNKGIAMVKAPVPGLCYIVPTGSKVEDGSHSRSLILNETEHSLEAETYSLDTQVLPGYIQDTSFIPSELDKECSVYQWMTISRGDEVSGQRVKRRAARVPCTKTVRVIICNNFNKCRMITTCRKICQGKRK